MFTGFSATLRRPRGVLQFQRLFGFLFSRFGAPGWKGYLDGRSTASAAGWDCRRAFTTPAAAKKWRILSLSTSPNFLVLDVNVVAVDSYYALAIDARSPEN